MRIKKVTLVLAVLLLCMIVGNHIFLKETHKKNEQKEEKNTTEIKKEEDYPLEDKKFVDTSDNIRVAIHTTNFQSLYHKNITLYCDTPYIVEINGKKQTKKAKEVVKIKKSKHTISIYPKEKNGRIYITSIKRSENTPTYRGKMMIYSKEKGLVLVNELSMEQYLYGVIPSEMPVFYGEEALKLQAVCARSYAMKQKETKRYEEFYADVVDSVASQVYQNTKEDGRANQAVRDTKGKILMYKGKIASTYFFSTSCGYTTNNTDVWYNNKSDKSPSYLRGSFQGKEKIVLNLKKEKDFRIFIKDGKYYDTFEKEMSWYRWNVKTNLMTISNQLSISYEKEMKKIGKLTKIEIVERGVGGVAKRCKITGKKGSFTIEKEYAIRSIFAGENVVAKGQNKAEMKVLNLLPSGYFYITQKKDKVMLYGGGFGHGVGMSQTGAKVMAEMGYMWEEMAKHYFKDVDIKTCY